MKGRQRRDVKGVPAFPRWVVWVPILFCSVPTILSLLFIWRTPAQAQRKISPEIQSFYNLKDYGSTEANHACSSSIVIAVQTSSRFFDSRTLACNQTWVQKARDKGIKVLFFADIDEATFPVIGLPVPPSLIPQLKRLSEVERGEKDIEWAISIPRTWMIWKHLYENYAMASSEAEWFMKVDDDTFLNVESLIEMVLRFEVKDPIHVGSCVDHVCAGGSGYLVNSKALTMMFEKGQSFPDCQMFMRNEDRNFGACMRSLSIPSVSISGFHQYPAPQPLHSSDWISYHHIHHKLFVPLHEELNALICHEIKTTNPKIFHGLDPSKETAFCAQTICCNGKLLSTSQINDDYCDCGLDEPGTAACAGQSPPEFYCKSGKKVFSSMVGDGIEDCDDGSDEVMLSQVIEPVSIQPKKQGLGGSLAWGLFILPLLCISFCCLPKSKGLKNKTP